ncbi:hypothetical protein NUW58_g6016 [Xylaria curta]|uniref:Uncharacterized protein n=1 Tax=Xylaria curta TaxID=42375 RepID=A0ACC1P035_9PEZI|nr:hypothetical protein NUW58_g6016 [Xylaria curta]
MKGVRFLRSLGQIPHEFSELLNELSTLQAVIEQVEVALRESEALGSTSSSTGFRSVDPSTVISSKDGLAQVVKELAALCDRLQVPRKSSKNQGCDECKSVSKLKWQKEKDNIARLRQSTQRTRELLSNDTSKSLLTYRKSYALRRKTFCSCKTSISRPRKEAKQSSGNFRGRLTKLKQDLAKRKPSSETGQVDASSENSTAEAGLVSGGLTLAPKAMIQFQAVLVPECSSTCNCDCHQIRHSRSPSWLATLIGNFFLQYNTTPLFQRPTCDKFTCTAKSRPSVRLYYVCPRWLLSRSIEFGVSWSSLTGSGSSLHIRVPRVLEKHSIWRAIRFGDLRWVQIHVANKSVLPTDVDTWGQSLATVAINHYQFELAQYFAQQGCDIHSKDIFGRSTAASQMRSIEFGSYSRPGTLQFLRSKKNILDEFSLQHQMRETVRFTRVHQAIIQGKDELLSALITSDPVQVNRLDDFGYAPLHWAVCQRKINILRALLEARADPCILSRRGTTPLRLAASFKDIYSAQLLLEYGADVNLPDPVSGETAIFCTALDAQLAHLLLRYGAHIQKETNIGIRTPLDDVAERFCYWEQNDDDRSLWASIAPIMFSLWNRNTILLGLLIDAGARLDLVDSRQNGILHYAALSTTVESIELLRRAEISGINPDLPNVDGETPLGWLASRLYALDEDLAPGERRVTTDEFWAFKMLIDETRERNDEKRRPDVGEVASDDVDSVGGWWGGSQLSDNHSVIQARSTSSGCDEFFDIEDELD